MFELALAMQRIYPDKFKTDAMARLLGADETLAAIKAGKTLLEIKAAWTGELTAFEARRKGFLLYEKPAVR